MLRKSGHWLGDPAILFIGVRNDGSIEGSINLDSMQQTLSAKLAAAYPPIYYFSKVLERDGKQFLAALIPGSDQRPHFAGPSYVRVGSETRKASESQYDKLIDQRQSKASDILRWKNQDITMERTYGDRSGRYASAVKVIGCNAFYVTLLIGNDNVSFSLTNVSISFDDSGRRLKLQIHEHAPQCGVFVHNRSNCSVAAYQYDRKRSRLILDSPMQWNFNARLRDPLFQNRAPEGNH